MKKVLLIEDDPVASTGYDRLFRAHGFDVKIARDGAAGLERLVEFVPDAVVLDMMLPKVGGLDVLRAIRSNKAFSNVPILVLTGACLPIIVEEAIEAGADRVFDKCNDQSLVIIELLHDLLKTSSNSRLVVPTMNGNPDACLNF